MKFFFIIELPQVQITFLRMNIMNIEEINQIRKDKGISVEELALLSKLPKSTVEKVLFGIVKLLLAGKERMTFGADIYLNNVNVFGSSGFKGLTASALHLNYLVIRMNVLLHIKHLVLIVTSLFFRCRMLLYYRFRYKSTIFRLFLFLRKKTLPTGCKIVTKTLDYFCAIYYTLQCKQSSAPSALLPSLPSPPTKRNSLN